MMVTGARLDKGLGHHFLFVLVGIVQVGGKETKGGRGERWFR